VLQCVAVCCSVLQCVAVCCSVLQCVAAHCNTLQHTATHCKMICYSSRAIWTNTNPFEKIWNYRNCLSKYESIWKYMKLWQKSEQISNHSSVIEYKLTQRYTTLYGIHMRNHGIALQKALHAIERVLSAPPI